MAVDAPLATSPIYEVGKPCLPMSGGDPLNDIAAVLIEPENKTSFV
jgi:hypothetical protein